MLLILSTNHQATLGTSPGHSEASPHSPSTVMPCNSDYMAPSASELQAARCACLLDELDGHEWTRNEWEGYHSRTYCKTTSALLDELVRELCSRLQALPSITQHSLELQIWWRDHQKADAERIAREQQTKQLATLRRQALAKLSPLERDALGLS